MDGINAASTANATAQVAAAVQMFALKQANQGQAAMLDTLMRTLSTNPPNLGNRVDATA
jgi:hypothetical protein